ncbi:MAG: hypothetical protein IJI43_04465 [Bacilli bacterium]|nr:hypothetical protein [Bacilli bacterium]
MSDAIGGVFNIVIIAVFLVLISGYMAFNVNYSKAFKFKNKIISNLEAYDGECGSGTNCANDIDEYGKKIGYSVFRISPNDISGDYSKVDGSYISSGSPSCPNNQYCIIPYTETIKLARGKNKTTRYYKVITVVNVDIPVINRIMPGIKLFHVTGDTKKMEV